MLLGVIDSNIIHIIGWWKLDTMLCYLHVSTKSLMHNHARMMIKGGCYNLIAPAPST